MAYGQTDEIIAERKARNKAVQLLLAVATEKKTVADVRSWLEHNYYLDFQIFQATELDFCFEILYSGNKILWK